MDLSRRKRRAKKRRNWTRKLSPRRKLRQRRERKRTQRASKISTCPMYYLVLCAIASTSSVFLVWAPTILLLAPTNRSCIRKPSTSRSSLVGEAHIESQVHTMVCFRPDFSGWLQMSVCCLFHSAFSSHQLHIILGDDYSFQRSIWQPRQRKRLRTKLKRRKMPLRRKLQTKRLLRRPLRRKQRR